MKNIEKLKVKAQAILSTKSKFLSEELKDLEFKELLHEIDVYHAEIEAQNEELLEKEHSLKKSLVLNQVLFDEAPFAYLYFDKNFKILNSNLQAYSLFSISIDNKNFNTFYKYIKKGNLDKFMNWVSSKDYENYPLEIDLVSHGSIRKFRLYLKNLDDLEGHFLMNILDIQEEYLLRKESEENSKLLFEVVQYQSNMVLVLDKQYQLKFVNKSLCEFFQLNSLEEFKEKYFDICTTFLQKEHFFHTNGLKDELWLRRLNQLDDSMRAVCIYNHKKKKEETFMINVAKVKNSDYICTFSEITNFSLQKEEFREKSYKDELTKIYNRTKFNEFLEHEFSYFFRANIDLSLIMFDIDFFKNINDKYGHDMGDKILIEVCQLTQKYVRKADIFARWGGEEFCILLKGCNLEQSASFAEIIRQKIQDNIFSNNIKLTCSFGIVDAHKSDTIDTFTKRADLALYKAKNSGRNCISY